MRVVQCNIFYALVKRLRMLYMMWLLNWIFFRSAYIVGFKVKFEIYGRARVYGPAAFVYARYLNGNMFLLAIHEDAK